MKAWIYRTINKYNSDWKAILYVLLGVFAFVAYNYIHNHYQPIEALNKIYKERSWEELSFDTKPVVASNKKSPKIVDATKEDFSIRIRLTKYNVPTEDNQYSIVSGIWKDKKTTLVVSTKKNYMKDNSKEKQIIIMNNNIMIKYNKNGTYTVYDAVKKEDGTFEKGDRAVFTEVNNVTVYSYESIARESDTPVTIANFTHRPSWDKKWAYNDNKYLGKLHYYIDELNDNKPYVVNELPLYWYMQGMAENVEGDPIEKAKALAIAIRSYAAYYSLDNADTSAVRKFGSAVYDGDDNPDSFQKYLGFGFTERSGEQWQKVVKETKGEVMTYSGNILRAAYSSCTPEDWYTKSPKEAKWGKYFTETTKEVYQKIKDEHGIDKKRLVSGNCGHGVGMSGFGAKWHAEQGMKYKDILKNYYQKIEFGQLNEKKRK